MATSLLALLDDIASLLDDVAAMTKHAASKTAGVLGDDLALNAQQVSGVQADRELPVVWAVAKGSFVNKLILVPLALLISALSPALVTALLMVGGAYLCFEGAEKVLHKLLHHHPASDAQHTAHTTDTPTSGDNSALEAQKIRGAIRTDFILSAEIIVISLGTMAAATLTQRIMALSAIAILMTVGVYGLVAAIVKLDDIGLWLVQKPGRAARQLGQLLLHGTPWLMRALSFLGTLAMFLVGGGILAHGIAPLVSWLHQIELSWGHLAGSITGILTHLGVGFAAGCVLAGLVQLVQRMRQAKPASTD